MSIPKKSINGHFERKSSIRTSSTAVVEKAKGVTGPAAAASKIATTRRASSTVEMKGMRRRSNRRLGNWISRALPIVSAVMPVLSERKKIGTATSPGSWRSLFSFTSPYLRSGFGAPVEQFIDWPGIDPPGRIQAEILGSLATVDLKFELSGRVSVGVEGEQAAHVHGHLEQPGGWVPALRT